jgi:hypothetical protein
MKSDLGFTQFRVSAWVAEAGVFDSNPFSLGKPARFDVRLPHKSTNWEALLDGQLASTQRTGLGETRQRLSANFLGSATLGQRELLP